MGLQLDPVTRGRPVAAPPDAAAPRPMQHVGAQPCARNWTRSRGFFAAAQGDRHSRKTWPGSAAAADPHIPGGFARNPGAKAAGLSCRHCGDPRSLDPHHPQLPTPRENLARACRRLILLAKSLGMSRSPDRPIFWIVLAGMTALGLASLVVFVAVPRMDVSTVTAGSDSKTVAEIERWMHENSPSPGFELIKVYPAKKLTRSEPWTHAVAFRWRRQAHGEWKISDQVLVFDKNGRAASRGEADGTWISAVFNGYNDLEDYKP